MPYITSQLGSGGAPLIDLMVSVSEPRQAALIAAGLPVAPPVTVRGLIDTGASGTCIDNTVLASLSLNPTGKTLIHTPSTAGTAHTVNQFDVSLIFPLPRLNWRIKALAVMESHLRNQGIQALIGRDVLNDAIFTYNGASQIFTLGF